MADNKFFNAFCCAMNGFFSYHGWDSDPHIAGFGLGVALWCGVDFLKALGDSR